MVARRPLVDVGGRVKQLPAGDRLDLPLATTVEPGLMPAADKAKLNGVQSGATANSTDSYLLDRANHTGTQPTSSINGLGTAALKNVTVSSIDTVTADAVMRRGDFGVGAQAVRLPFGYDINTATPNGLYYVDAPLNGPPGDGFGTSGYLTTLSLNENYGLQTFTRDGGDRFTRLKTAGSFLGWTVDWSARNFNPSNYSTTAEMQAAIISATRGINVSSAGGSAAITASLFSNGPQYIRFTGTAAVSLAVPANSAEAVPVGAELTMRRAAAGNLTILPASGVIVNPPAGGTLVLTQNMTATLKKVATNEWDLIGQTVPA